MWDYTEKVKDHFLHPRNVGEVENPDAVGEVGNVVCGDALKLTIKLDKNGKIRDARFKTFGCASAIASSSALTELIKGKTLEEAGSITNKDIAEYLGGLPEEKMHCSVMGMEALESAIANYRGEKITPKIDEGTIVCKCFGVTDTKIARVVRENNLHSVDEVTHFCKAGGACGKCHDDIREIISEVWGKEKEKKLLHADRKKEKKKLTNIQRINLIQETIENKIRPALQNDGGDVELVDVEGNKVLLTLKGACQSCPSAGITMKKYIERLLREAVIDDIVVEEVKG